MDLPGEDLERLTARLDRIEERLDGRRQEASRRSQPVEAALVSSHREPSPELAATSDALVGEGEPRVVEEPALDAEEVRRRKELVDGFAKRFDDPNLSLDDKRRMWREIAAAGISDEVIALLEVSKEQRPTDATVAADLGNAYAAKLQSEVLSSFEKRELSSKANAEFDRALKLDEGHWEARFSKSMMQVFAPKALGLDLAAAKNLEILVDQQRTAPQQPHFAHTYFFLANIHEARGDRDRAAAIRGEARSLFPGDRRFGR